MLEKKLSNEEAEAKARFKEVTITSEDYWQGERCSWLEVPTVRGMDRVEVVKVFHIRGLKARGYEKIGKSIILRYLHNFDIYILRSYPFPDEKRVEGIKEYAAPIRIVHISNIFHPNIEPGPEAGSQYYGRVCWNIFYKRAWEPTFKLSSLMISYKNLIEMPNPEDPITRVGICLEAASWFRKHGITRYASRPARRLPRVVRG